MPDKRDCTNYRCLNFRMEYKYSFSNEEFAPELWQCPNCKNIEVISKSIGKGYKQ